MTANISSFADEEDAAPETSAHAHAHAGAPPSPSKTSRHRRAAMNAMSLMGRRKSSIGTAGLDALLHANNNDNDNEADMDASNGSSPLENTNTNANDENGGDEPNNPISKHQPTSVFRGIVVLSSASGGTMTKSCLT